MPVRHSLFSRRWAQGWCLYSLPAGERRKSRRFWSLACRVPLTSVSHAHHRIASVVTGRVSLGLVARGSHHRLQEIPSAHSLYAGRSPELGTVPLSSFWSSPGFYKPEGDDDDRIASEWLRNARARTSHILSQYERTCSASWALTISPKYRHIDLE